jgi:hypothetical protein
MNYIRGRLFDMIAAVMVHLDDMQYPSDWRNRNSSRRRKDCSGSPFGQVKEIRSDRRERN